MYVEIFKPLLVHYRRQDTICWTDYISPSTKHDVSNEVLVHFHINVPVDLSPSKMEDIAFSVHRADHWLSNMIILSFLWNSLSLL